MEAVLEATHVAVSDGYTRYFKKESVAEFNKLRKMTEQTAMTRIRTFRDIVCTM